MIELLQHQNEHETTTIQNKQAETLLFFLCRIYLLAVNWQSCMITIVHKVQEQYIQNLSDNLYNKTYKLLKNNFALTIPKLYLSDLTGSCMPFSIQIVSEDFQKPILDSWSAIACNIIQLGPHGVQCEPTAPLIVTTLLHYIVEDGDVMECLYSTSNFDEPPKWQKYPTKITQKGNFVQFEVFQLCVFTVILKKPRHSIQKRIALCGGEVNYHKDDNKVDMYFPPNSINESYLDVSIELLHYDTFYVSDHEQNLLAGPVVCLGPSGSSFKKDVKITMPLPKGKEVKRLHKNPTLSFMVSQTTVGVKPYWKPLQTEYKVNWESEPCTVTFSVKHFSVYKALWNILDVGLPESVKLHASSHVPGFSFWTHFQAYMTDCKHNKQFGICVVGHRLATKSFEGFQEYPLEIGRCKPRKMKAGKLSIKLKSQMFTVDESLGESSTGLVKNVDFTGHDFDTQFSCVLNTRNNIPDVEMFGKVFISQVDPDQGNEIEELSFNLIKKQHQSIPAQQPSQWRNNVTKQLAGMLSTEQYLWNKLASSLGYNSAEIKIKFSNKQEPVFAIFGDYIEGGGNEEDFLQCMFSVAEYFKMNIPLANEQLEGKCFSNEQQQQHFENSNSNFGEVKLGKRTYGEALYNDMTPLIESQLDDIARNIARHWKNVGRKLNLNEHELNDIDLNFSNSSEREKAFQMLLAWRERFPDDFTIAEQLVVKHITEARHTLVFKSLKLRIFGPIMRTIYL